MSLKKYWPENEHNSPNCGLWDVWMQEVSPAMLSAVCAHTKKEECRVWIINYEIEDVIHHSCLQKYTKFNFHPHSSHVCTHIQNVYMYLTKTLLPGRHTRNRLRRDSTLWKDRSYTVTLAVADNFCSWHFTHNSDTPIMIRAWQIVKFNNLFFIVID